MTTFIDETVSSLDAAIAVAREELEKLAAARKALTAVPSSENGRTPGRRRQLPLTQERAEQLNADTGFKTPVVDRKPPRAKAGERLAQALALVESKPGITGKQIGQAFGSATYGYSLVQRLKDAGKITKSGDGWQVK